ncbi:hypothetical protein JKP88DRAFT_261534 [Tribonema minus]|uniref:Uncharacterized protein n=1 Tax=Tribonema minus TaxID=303371 RepID=A0A835YJI8_9STRA|nr:hypothetical protein JKP88DRAFT_261534 [Tribonema minus]
MDEAGPPCKKSKADSEAETRPAHELQEGDSAVDAEPDVQLQAVLAVQQDLTELEHAEAAEIMQISEAYQKRKQPLYTQRQQAIVEADPGFWATVLQAHSVTRRYIGDCDGPLLQYLKEVNVVTSTMADRNEDVADLYTVSFTFSPNPFLKGTKLWRRCMRSIIADVCSAAPFEVLSQLSVSTTADAQQSAPCTGALTPPALPLICTRRVDDMPQQPSLFSVFESEAPAEDDHQLCEAIRTEVFPDPVRLYLNPESTDDEDEVLGDLGEEEDDGQGDDEGDGDQTSVEKQTSHQLARNMFAGVRLALRRTAAASSQQRQQFLPACTRQLSSAAPEPSAASGGLPPPPSVVGTTKEERLRLRWKARLARRQKREAEGKVGKHKRKFGAPFCELDSDYVKARRVYRQQVTELRKQYKQQSDERLAAEEQARRAAMVQLQKEKAVRYALKLERSAENRARHEAEAEKARERYLAGWAAVARREEERAASDARRNERLIAALEEESRFWLSTPERIDEGITDALWTAEGAHTAGLNVAGEPSGVPGSEFWRYTADTGMDETIWREAEDEEDEEGDSEGEGSDDYYFEGRDETTGLSGKASRSDDDGDAFLFGDDDTFGDEDAVLAAIMERQTMSTQARLAVTRGWPDGHLNDTRDMETRLAAREELQANSLRYRSEQHRLSDAQLDDMVDVAAARRAEHFVGEVPYQGKFSPSQRRVSLPLAKNSPDIDEDRWRDDGDDEDNHDNDFTPDSAPEEYDD